MTTFRHPCYNLQAELRLWQWLPLCAVPQRTSSYWTRSNISSQLRAAEIMTTVWLTSTGNKNNAAHKTRPTHPVIFGISLPLSLSHPLLTTVRKPIYPNSFSAHNLRKSPHSVHISPACLPGISAAYWLCFKNANVIMHYARALGFPLMPRTEEMDATRLIDQETQNTGSSGWTRDTGLSQGEKTELTFSYSLL